MLLKIKNYFSDVKHIINVILIILVFNTIVNIFSGHSIISTIVPLLYFIFIRFSKKVKLSIWNMVFLIWVVFEFVMVPGFEQLVNLGGITLVLYFLLINFGDKLKILNKKSLSIAFAVCIICCVISCCSVIKFFLTTEFGFTGLAFLGRQLGLSAVIALNIIGTILNHLYLILVIIYFKQFADYKIRGAKNER